MTINDFVAYDSPMNASITGAAVTVGIAFVGMMAFVLYLMKAPRIKNSILASVGGASAVLVAASIIISLSIAGGLREAEAEAQTANAATLQAWVEKDYGITVGRDTAVSVIQAHANRWETVFEAEAETGTVELELKESDGVFRLIQTGTVLKAVDGQ